MKHIWGIGLCYLALTVVCHGSEQWTITKENGAYRVNGCRLAANGRLADANGMTAKTLTPQDIREIGEAIDRFEAGHDSPYAAPAVAGPYKPAPEPQTPPSAEIYQPPPAPSVVNQKSGNEDPPAAESKSSFSSKSILFGLSVIYLLGCWVYVTVYPNKCPRCGERISVNEDSSAELGSRSGFVDVDVVKTDVHRDNLGRQVGTTDRTESKTVYYSKTLVETKYSCKKCRNRWLKKEWI